MTKIKRLLAFFLTLVMIAMAVAPLAACSEPEPEPGEKPCTSHVDSNGDGKCDNEGCDAPVAPSQDGKTATYTVEIKTIGGMHLSGVTVDLYNSEGDLVAYKKTDDEGRVTFTAPAGDTYEVMLTDGVPKGYTVADSYAVTSYGTLITLATELLPPATGLTYQLGDIMHDFTVYDSDGNAQNLATILESKKAVVLNFWYTTCTWCVQEFPAIQAAYETVYDEESGRTFSDDIEVLALNCWVEGNAAIKSFKETYGLSFPMADDSTGLYTSFGFSAAPCTVIVDRYGMVSVIEIGAVLGANSWRKVFSAYVSDEYKQDTFSSMEELIPRDVPDVTQPSTEEIYDSFVAEGENLTVDFHPETSAADAYYSWPFTTSTYVDKDGNEIKCIVPTNKGKDNSYATIYAEIYLDAGEALVFDYHSSTESTASGADVLYVIVNGKDMFSIFGKEDEDVWKRCCAYVAEESGTYTVAFCYQKDGSDEVEDIDDLVYLKNLRVLPAEELDVQTYIFRYAATKPSSDGYEFGSYADVYYNEEDGYYHVHSVDGPLLLANLMGYTNFDRTTYVWARIYYDGGFVVSNADGKYTHLVDGKDYIYHLELYANYANNSAVYGYTPVTAQLKELLDAYVAKYAATDGIAKEYNENTWLQLCAYYDAYGLGVEQMADPIRGYATFSPFYAEETTDPENPVYNKVTYTTTIVPRGLLYAFTPTKSGVYRFISQSTSAVDAWIFTGSHDEWADNEGQRILYLQSNQGERFNPYLVKDTDGDGVYELDTKNASMVAYLEEGVTYYVAFAFWDSGETGSLTFTVAYEAEEFYFFGQASDGTFTTELDAAGNMGNIIAGGIDVTLADNGYYYHYNVLSSTTSTEAVAEGDEYYGVKDGTYYAYEYSADGEWLTKITKTVVSSGSKTVTVENCRGSLIYADFIWTTNIFTTRTLQQLIDAHSFDFTFSSSDLEGISVYSTYAKNGVIKHWITEDFEAEWTADGREAALSAEGKTTAEIASIKASELALLLKELTSGEAVLETLFDELWIKNEREAALTADGKTEDEIAEIKKEELAAYIAEKLAAQAAYSEKWVSEGGQAITDGWYTKTYYDAPAYDELLTLYHKYGYEGFAEYYGWEESRDEAWIAYRMDEVLAGIFHGSLYSASDAEVISIVTAGLAEYLENQWGDNYAANMAAYGIDDILAAFRNGTLCVDEALNADGIEIFEDAVLALLESAWGENYETNLEKYMVSDILAGKFHNDYTEEIQAIFDENIKYVDEDKTNIEYDEDYPERQGCVAVDARLAELLQMLMDKYTFKGVLNSWTKMCYYYEYIGPAAD